MRRTIVVAALGLAAVLGLAGCGSGSGANSSAGSGPKAQEVAPNPASAGGSGAGFDAQQQRPADLDPAKQEQPASVDQRQVVRTAQISVEVDDVAQAAGRAREVATRFHGFVSDEKTGDESASIELRVAADQLDDALTALAGLGPKVLSRGQQAQDVTDQVVDVQARLESQRASVERVRALLGKATTIGEIVQIESELTRREADLESLQRRSASLSGQVELATVSAQFSRPGAAIGRSDDSGFLDGLSAGWRVFLASTQVLLTIFGAVLPFLVALAIPAVVIAFALRRRRTPAPTPTPATVPPSA